jgi:DNA-binding GntR family transcriptional regulator
MLTRLLREEGLIVYRQGSGVFVRERAERSIGLRPHIERAFDNSSFAVLGFGWFGEWRA